MVCIVCLKLSKSDMHFKYVPIHYNCKLFMRIKLFLY